MIADILKKFFLHFKRDKAEANEVWQKLKKQREPHHLDYERFVKKD